MQSFKLETVHAITDYVDCILSGIADYHGKPHIFLIAWPPLPREVPAYHLWPVELPVELRKAIAQSKNNIWKASEELLNWVHQTSRLTQYTVCARANFQPQHAIVPRDNSPISAMLVTWQETGMKETKAL